MYYLLTIFVKKEKGSLPFSKSITFAAKTPYDLSYKLCGQEGERQEHRVRELRCQKGRRAEYASAKIGEQKLNCADKQDYKDERAVFCKSREKIQSVCARTETAE